MWDLDAVLKNTATATRTAINPGTAPCHVLNAIAQMCERRGFAYWTPRVCEPFGTYVLEVTDH